MKKKISLIWLISIFCIIFSMSAYASKWDTSKKAVIGDTFVIQLKNASGTFQWSNTDADVATIMRTNSANAVKVVARAKGKTTVTVTNNGKTYKCKVKVYKPNFGVTSDIILQKGKSIKFKLSGGYGKKKVVSTKSKVAKLSKKGNKVTLKGKKVGKSKLKITYCDRTVVYNVKVVGTSITTPKMAVAVGDGSSVNKIGTLLRKYGNVSPETVNTDVNPANYVGLVVPMGLGDVDPLLYGDINRGLSRYINRDMDIRQIAIINKFVSAGKPILALGKGMHILNVALGGSLYQNDTRHYPALVRNHTTSGSFLGSVFKGETYSLCYHHQTIRALGAGLRVSMYAPDGVIEGIESTSRHIYGIQWDTENIQTIEEPVFLYFIRVCT